MSLERESCTSSYCEAPQIIEMDTDILLIGGGMACCGAAFEVMPYAKKYNLKVTLVDKAAMDRSGAVAQGLSAINTYLGGQDPADYVKMVANDLMGIVRDDLIYDVGRHVDDSVHLFEKWGLPVWKADQQPDSRQRAPAGGRGAGHPAIGCHGPHDPRRRRLRPAPDQ